MKEIIKTKLHASQLYIPQQFLKKLSIGKESEVFLEFDEENNSLIITVDNKETISKDWIINAIMNPPKTIEGNDEEDLREYDYSDI